MEQNKAPLQFSLVLAKISEEESLNNINNSKISSTTISSIYNGNFKYYDKYQTKKWKSFKNMSFINKKRKNIYKSFDKEFPRTPHNTGQYLAHIHQGFDFKKQKALNSDKKITDLACNDGIKYFDDEDDLEINGLGDLDKDMQIFREKEIQRRLSVDENELKNHLLKSQDDINYNIDVGNFERNDIENLEIRKIKSTIF